ncbi:carbohydrate ABC transporter membrane protein 1, CUT1 family [Microlunatus sagamiharensis]|uniref:Carbohydrate ABC transporter membrane protein 1, CUT1 family n=1 Tax=Microlunatus sagamiharensis TaxID=546874 RepID=A0A1H2MM11_9ACTN|nr:sugar ABC transporter permease [Microlunatus sagamiharensis]SDU94152.1 carbohydrate ABC transporter membrane protein 1, CUT1 family [Microlunatus sagamiharensis]
MTTTSTTAPIAAAGARQHRRVRATTRRGITAWLFLAPSLIILFAFTLYPMIQAAYLSLTDYNLIRAARFVGLDNYRELVGDPDFWNAFGNTLLYAVVVTPVTVVLALLLAVLLNRPFVGRAFARTAIFLPFIVSLGIIAIAWSFLLDPNIGLLSYWLAKVGIVPEQGWLTDPRYAMAAVMAVGVWKNVGFYMVIYLAGIQSIPADVYEAARLDGAGAWQRFRSMTLPLLANQTLLVAVLALIASLQAFDQIYVMTHGGPFFRTETLVVLIYREGFQSLRFGYASAISFVLLILVFVLSMVQFGWLRRREVRY